MYNHLKNKLKIHAIIFFLLPFIAIAQNKKEIIGKWDLEVAMNGKILPSWLQVKQSGTKALVGYFVAHNGSARPISEVFYHDGILDFSIPPQFDGYNDMHFQGILSNGILKGTILSSEGDSYSFSGVPAPKLIRNTEIKWGKASSIFNGINLEGWHSSDKKEINQWIAEDGLLKNPKSGVNLISNNLYNDFKLHIEVRYPKGSNSGIYLRGRYEVQIEDSYGSDPESILFGGIYGFLTPNEMAANPAGQWQIFDITLIGRRVSIIANGKPIITDQIIPGITGGAIDSKESMAGPIMLQGDHGKVEYRNIKIQQPK
tara:strand:- start:110 stop:1054 length:945 start_codon:yes stop_codon:yes gene_type:complete